MSKATITNENRFELALTMNKLTPWFYGWNIVAMTFFRLVMARALLFGVLLKPLSENPDASRFVVSLALTGQIIMSAVLAMAWSSGRRAAHSRADDHRHTRHGSRPRRHLAC